MSADVACEWCGAMFKRHHTDNPGDLTFIYCSSRCAEAAQRKQSCEHKASGMANYYRHFAENFGPLSPAGMKWLTARLKKDEDKEDDDGNPLVDFRWLKTCSESGKGAIDTILFTTDESGSVEAVGRYVQAYLKKFAPTKFWVLSWADVCDKNRPGGFGGGLMLVTAEKIEVQEADEWIAQRTSGPFVPKLERLEW